MKLDIIAGARPNFMKIAPIIAAIEKVKDKIQYRLIHTGQHYDKKCRVTFSNNSDSRTGCKPRSR